MIYPEMALLHKIKNVSFYCARQIGLGSRTDAKESYKSAPIYFTIATELHEEPIPVSKQRNNEKHAYILDGVATLDEPKIYMNKVSNLKEEIEKVDENVLSFKNECNQGFKKIA
ncbi:hypothetical protein CWI39_0685p0010 [Hamiltosporidium magnivora]|uniref:Uncharacterized protein n=1 Tax=Hamiltosporidium magnivora TaxID=148818 RepID=A0A4Q9LEW8_9MICR|nr:hypothetical protein CWI39_0685p0010 [Hamiltosporidium magnivora]